MVESRSLRDQQFEFAAHLRDPDRNPPPAGIEDRRMKVYRDLFIGSISSLLGSTFPVLRQLYSDPAWRKLARSFYSTHRSHTPIFMEIPQEFLAYLLEEHTAQDDDPPFLLELAHYEWVELAVSIADHSVDWDSIDPAGDLLENVPALSPFVESLAYQFPVHRINKDFQPSAPLEEATLLVVYRDLQDEVGFLEINPVTARLLELLRAERQLTGRQMLERIGDELKHPNPDTVIAGGKEILDRLRRHDVLLGTYR